MAAEAAEAVVVVAVAAAGKPGKTGTRICVSGIGRQAPGMLGTIEAQVFIVAEKTDDGAEKGFLRFTMPPAIRRPIGKLSGPDGRRIIGS